jgi:hypothetical protein
LGELRMGEKLFKFDEGSCAEEEARIRARIKELRAAEVGGETMQISTATPQKREC